MLEGFGVKEPEARHIALAESLVFSENPSARGYFPGNVTVTRCYDRLQPLEEAEGYCIELSAPGEYTLPGFRLQVSQALFWENTPYRFTVSGGSPIVVRSRRAGDMFTTPGGTKSLKKLFIDRKIPAHRRNTVPVVASQSHVLGVCGLGANLQEQKQEPVCVLEFFQI
jgi:tRNA(Ile)-lysidine synthetase-like protein